MNFKDRLCAMNCHYRFYELEDFLQSIRKLDMHYVELWSGPVHYYVDTRRHNSLKQLRKLCDRHQIAIIDICPKQTNPKLNNIAVEQRRRQKEILSYYRQTIDIACALRYRQVLVTSGWCCYNETVEEAWSRSVIMMKRVTDYARQRSVILTLEALQSEESCLVDMIQDVGRYRSEVGGSCLKVYIDFGAMARMGHAPREHFGAFGSGIVHICFVDGNPAGHPAWGDGSHDLKTDLVVLEEYSYQGYLLLETATQGYYRKSWSTGIRTLKNFEE